MSLRISSAALANQRLTSRRLDQLRVSDVKVNNADKGSSEVKEGPKAVSDNLRFELSSLNRESVNIQRNISAHQETLGALDKLEKSLVSAQENLDNPEELEAAIDQFEETVGETTFEDRQLLNTNPNSSDNEKVEAVTVQRPPKVGTYSVSIVASEDESTQKVKFAINVSDNGDYKKQVITSFSPATGLVDGIELYFELKEGETLDATIEVKPTDEDSFPVPNFEKDAQAFNELKSGDRDELADRLRQSLNKVETTKQGVEDSLDTEKAKFQTLASTQENIQASTNDISSVSNAFSLIEDANAKIASSENASDLFNNTNPDQALDLLE